MARPRADEAAEYFHRYISIPEGDSVSEIVNKYAFELQEFYNNLPESRADFAYAEGKWTVKEVLQHVADTERIFAYRALCIARGETASLPGFDENAYAANSNGDSRSRESLLEEWTVVRKATILLFNSFTDEQISRTGTANNKSISVAAIGFICAGHALHHVYILKERYLA